MFIKYKDFSIEGNRVILIISIWWDAGAALEASVDATKARATFEWHTKEYFKLEEASFLQILTKWGEVVANPNECFAEVYIFLVDFGTATKFYSCSKVNFLT